MRLSLRRMGARCGIMKPMRRLARHVFTLLSALSLLLCVAVCVLWALSYRHTHTAGYYNNHWESRTVYIRTFGMTADTGGLLFFTMNRRAMYPKVGFDTDFELNFATSP